MTFAARLIRWPFIGARESSRGRSGMLTLEREVLAISGLARAGVCLQKSKQKKAATELCNNGSVL